MSEKKGEVWKLPDGPAFRFWIGYVPQASTGDWDEDVWSSIGHLESESICVAHLSGLHQLKRRDIKKCVRRITAHISQAVEFRNSAIVASIKCSPLLYYYSFLNLAKAYILCKFPQLTEERDLSHHGVSLARLKKGKQILYNDKVRVNADQRVWQWLYRSITNEVYKGKDTLGVEELFMYCAEVGVEVLKTFGNSCFLVRILGPSVRIDRKTKKIWMELCIDKEEAKIFTLSKERLVKLLNKSGKRFKFIAHPTKNRYCFEQSSPFQYQGHKPIFVLPKVLSLIRNLNLYIDTWGKGYHLPLFELSNLPRLPELIVIYTLMYYFGMLVRYNPVGLEQLLKERSSLLIDSFLRSCSFKLASLFEQHLYECQIPRYLGFPAISEDEPWG